MYTEASNVVAASIIAILDVMLVCTDDMAFRVLLDKVALGKHICAV